MNSYDLITKFRNHLGKTGLIHFGQHVVVAVSGGMDSMCLLFLFNELKDELGFHITVGHINHQIRTDSKRDEAFVKMTCAKIGFPIITKQLNPSTRTKRESWEAWARIRRYQKLEAIRREVRADVIITAHHGNDQIETILMRMGEGSGIGGWREICTPASRRFEEYKTTMVKSGSSGATRKMVAKMSALGAGICLFGVCFPRLLVLLPCRVS